MADIASYLSQIGLPAGTIAVAVGLVQGAKFLESDANPRALRYVSELLTEGDLKNIGKASVGLVPFVFDKVFGARPFSLRFISRSIIATTAFWLILLLAKHANLIDIFVPFNPIYYLLIPLWYILDWISLVKARALITLINSRYAILSSLGFMIIDIAASYILACFFELFIIDTAHCSRRLRPGLRK